VSGGEVVIFVVMCDFYVPFMVVDDDVGVEVFVFHCFDEGDVFVLQIVCIMLKVMSKG
jgi:hypothetical protein